MTAQRLVVWYNTRCPVCDAGIGHQRNALRDAVRAGRIEFHDINAQPDALAAYGASLDDIRRRLHATDEAGRLIVGADVMLALWRITPGERWLAALFGNPVMLPLTRFGYDRFADLLFTWNKRKGRMGEAVQDRGESVRELTAFPQMITGAPSPLILANENRLALAYYLNATAPAADGSFATIRSLNSATDVEPVALVKIEFEVIRFGYPNDEALNGHRLFDKGLRWYGVWEVLNSSWRDELEHANRKHPKHVPGLFDGLQHIIFTFHDSTLEVLSNGFEVEVHHQSVSGMLPMMQDFVRG